MGRCAHHADSVRGVQGTVPGRAGGVWRGARRGSALFRILSAVFRDERQSRKRRQTVEIVTRHTCREYCCVHIGVVLDFWCGPESWEAWLLLASCIRGAAAHGRARATHGMRCRLNCTREPDPLPSRKDKVAMASTPSAARLLLGCFLVSFFVVVTAPATDVSRLFLERATRVARTLFFCRVDPTGDSRQAVRALIPAQPRKPLACAAVHLDPRDTSRRGLQPAGPLAARGTPSTL